MIPSTLKECFAPALLVYSKAEAEKKLSFISEHYPNAHLHVDVMDKKFVPATCWCKPVDIKKLHIKQSFEAHLMTFHPEKRVAAWKRACATRIVFHIEATDHPLAVIETIRKHRLEVAIALNPKTALKTIALLTDKVDGILFMGVMPGLAGQPFQHSVLKKIRTFHHQHPRTCIIVDGGVTSTNARVLIKEGARQLVSTSAVYGSSTYGRT